MSEQTVTCNGGKTYAQNDVQGQHPQKANFKVTFDLHDTFGTRLKLLSAEVLGKGYTSHPHTIKDDDRFHSVDAHDQLATLTGGGEVELIRSSQNSVRRSNDTRKDVHVLEYDVTGPNNYEAAEIVCPLGPKARTNVNQR